MMIATAMPSQVQSSVRSAELCSIVIFGTAGDLTRAMQNVLPFMAMAIPGNFVDVTDA